jgi:hypothetical protein
LFDWISLYFTGFVFLSLLWLFCIERVTCTGI